jgi:hypothetical protein
MAARKPDHRVLIEQGDGIYASDKRVYEAQGIRGGDIDSTGEVWTAEVLECQNDEKAVAIARELSEEWKSRIKLYRVPFVNTTSRASRELWLDQMKLIVDIPELTSPIEFLAWMDELNREATRRGYPEWPLPEEIAHGFNCWIERFNKGLTPAEALDAITPLRSRESFATVCLYDSYCRSQSGEGSKSRVSGPYVLEKVCFLPIRKYTKSTLPRPI